MTQSLDTFPLIPREDLFGNPTRAGGKLSPDGKWLGWLAPRDGVLNVWMAPSNDPSGGKPMTHATDRPIRDYIWAPDSRSLVYVQDKDGDENFLLYGVNIETGRETPLTPFENTRAMLVGASTKIRDKLLVALNNRDERLHDVHLLDLNTGDLTEVFRNELGFAGFVADNDLQIRLVARPNEAGGTDYFTVTDGEAAGEPIETTTLDDSLTTGTEGFTADGKTLYWRDSRGRDTAALIAHDLDSGEKRVIAEDAKADIDTVMRNPVTRTVEAYEVEYLKKEWFALDREIGASLEWLGKRLDGEFGVMSRTIADDKWVVWHDPLTSPLRTYLFDRSEMTLTGFYVTRPELEDAPLQPMHAVEIEARDGLVLPSYLTLPPGCDPDTGSMPSAPVPMVLLVHGGPWARDAYGFNAHHQWLANRGYAVLSVNFRGSTGFGKTFVAAANLEWGRKMHDDLIDAVDWAIGQGIASPGKVAIMGGSYGGYATLAGLSFTPDTFACGVDIVGPSNLETLLETIPPYWEPMIAQFHERMGNPNKPDGLAMLQERSPLHSASKITKPLLIAQGANDPRVKQSESDQIVDAMKQAGIPVTYVLFPDEGHGFAKPANNIAFTAITESFLAARLGGRAEALGATVTASTAEIVEGAEFIRGLESALAG